MLHDRSRWRNSRLLSPRLAYRLRVPRQPRKLRRRGKHFRTSVRLRRSQHLRLRGLGRHRRSRPRSSRSFARRSHMPRIADRAFAELMTKAPDYESTTCNQGPLFFTTARDNYGSVPIFLVRQQEQNQPGRRNLVGYSAHTISVFPGTSGCRSMPRM